MENLYICGVGGHAKVAFEICESLGFRPEGFLYFKNSNSSEIEPPDEIYRVPIFEINSTLFKLPISMHIAIGDNLIRRKIKSLLLNKFDNKIHYPNLVHPTSYVAKDVQIGQGNLIAAKTFIGKGSRIGDFCIINSSSSIDHDNQIADYVNISPGVITGGKVSIGSDSRIGMGVHISNNVSVGEQCIIGAMSFVKTNIHDNQIVMGIPAKSKL